MILSIQEYEALLPNTDEYFDEAKMTAFEIRALYKYFPKFLGDTLTETIEVNTTDVGLISKIKPALGCLAILESVPFLDLVATNNGFAIISNTNIAPASRERVQALRDGCLVAANVYFDRMLAYLETHKSESAYSAWNKSCINTDSLLPGVTEFIAATAQHIERHVFVDLIPVITSIESTWMKESISAEFLTEMQASSDKIVKPLLQKALAFATKSKVETENPEISKKDGRMASQFLMQAIKYLYNHLSSYSTFATYGYETPFDNANTNNIGDDGNAYGIFIFGAP